MQNSKNIIIEQIKNFFETKPIIKVFLFGSYARDEATEKSDIDILVELDYSVRIGLGFFKMESDLSKILNKKVDLLTTNSISKFIKPQVDSEKILIYERK